LEGFGELHLAGEGASGLQLGRERIELGADIGDVVLEASRWPRQDRCRAKRLIAMECSSLGSPVKSKPMGPISSEKWVAVWSQSNCADTVPIRGGEGQGPGGAGEEARVGVGTGGAGDGGDVQPLAVGLETLDDCAILDGGGVGPGEPGESGANVVGGNLEIGRDSWGGGER
jgi:hypothetical protein